jgi:L-seryl-tRNA(Ser) seleniumtransferase
MTDRPSAVLRASRSRLPSVDRLARHPALQESIALHGRPMVIQAVRDVLDHHRQSSAAPGSAGPDCNDIEPESALALQAAHRVAEQMQASLRPVLNLTGTVLHTNLGRAPLPPEALEAIAAVSRGASNLEFDLTRGLRGERDDHVSGWLRRLTGAPAAVVVNNNAAAVVLLLRALAARREVLVSRGELIELGGSFRLPDIMREAGCVLREVGTTNRTHLHDFAEAIGPRTAMVMQVHTSNYRIEGYTHAVDARDLASLCQSHGLPFVVDLGSGTLTDLTALGLPAEPTPAQAIAQGADLVSFSGDKLLGGPQAGMIVGRADLIAKLRKHPLKRALRCDKMTLAALEAVLRLYADPDRLAQRVPGLRWLTRGVAELQAQAAQVQPSLQDWLDAGAVKTHWQVDVVSMNSQIGSGALPVASLPSAGLCIRPRGRARGADLQSLALRLRSLPLPVIGRVAQDALWLDLRCLDDPDGLIRQLKTCASPVAP